MYGNASETQAASYDRNNPLYPYKSHGQWLKASYGLVACVILILLNGVGAFLEDPFDTRKFISAYISVGASWVRICFRTNHRGLLFVLESSSVLGTS
jgi:amino acid transporter